ncbi:MAG: hypothetical protein ACE5KM_09945 [Planctomycetaceae bacterium]
MEALTYDKFLKLLEDKSGAGVVMAFRDFRRDLESKHSESRLKFVLLPTALDIQVKPPRPRPTTPKGIRELISTTAFTVRGKRGFNKIGVCFTMDKTEIGLRHYRYPPHIATEFYDGLAAIDGRLRVGRPLAQQLPLRDLDAEILTGIAKVIDELITNLEKEPADSSPSLEPDVGNTPADTSHADVAKRSRCWHE